jgi:reverse gyrase
MDTKSNDGWYKTEVVVRMVRMIGTLLIPLVIFYIGTKIQEQQDNADKEQRDSDRITRLLQSLSSENERERRLAISFSRYLADSGKFPPELIHVFGDILESGEQRDMVRGAEEVLAAAAEHDPNIARDIGKTMKGLPAAVFIQIKDESQKQFAEEIAETLRREGFRVQDIRQEQPKYRLVGAELRYYHSELRKEAQHITEIIQRNNGLRVKPVEHSSRRVEKPPDVHIKHYELWIGDI